MSAAFGAATPAPSGQDVFEPAEVGWPGKTAAVVPRREIVLARVHAHEGCGAAFADLVQKEATALDHYYAPVAEGQQILAAAAVDDEKWD